MTSAARSKGCELRRTGVAAGMLASLFPQDAARLRYMAAEERLSRVVAGIHYNNDVEVGAELGRRVAELALQRDAMDANQ